MVALHFLGMIMKIRDRFGRIRLPGWVLVMVTVVYDELLLHLWITDRLHFGRLGAVGLFALGCGCMLALAAGFLGGKAQKRAAVSLCLIISVFWLAEFFVRDSYKVFMTPRLMISGAGGVATDYMDQVITAVVNGWWRIALLLIPTALYGVFCKCGQTRWNVRAMLAGAAVAAYALGMLVVHQFTPDGPKLNARYEFDEAADCFGMHVALILESTRESGGGAKPAFVAAPDTPALPRETVAVPEIEYADNVMEELDFAALAEGEKNSHVAALHSYVNSLTPTKRNAMTGLFEGKNLKSF